MLPAHKNRVHTNILSWYQVYSNMLYYSLVDTATLQVFLSLHFIFRLYMLAPITWM